MIGSEAVERLLHRSRSAWNVAADEVTTNLRTRTLDTGKA
jgi:hypothetical protein